MFFNTRGIQNITPRELNNKITLGEDFLLLDVRTPMEHAVQTLEGSYLIPIKELNYRVNELPRDREIIVYCRVGNRSAFAAAYLSRMGFKVKNLEGGIEAWNRIQEPALTRLS